MSGIDWLEIEGSPTVEERRLLRAAVEQYLATEAPAPEPAWRTGRGPAVRQRPAGASPSWNGLNKAG